MLLEVIGVVGTILTLVTVILGGLLGSQTLIMEYGIF